MAKGIVQHIPNAITLCNLSCGILSIIYAQHFHFFAAAYLIFAGAIFDFLDGMAARGLKAYSPIGKQLDSMADLVTFGVAPGMLMYQISYYSTFYMFGDGTQLLLLPSENNSFDPFIPRQLIALICLTIPVFAAMRLAKFNVTESGSRDFKGLPSPANGLFFALWALSFNFGKLDDIPTMLAPLFTAEAYAVGSLLLGLLMISNLPMPSLKITGLKGDENKKRLLVLVIIVLLTIVGIVVNKIFLVMWFAVPLYIILSLIFYLTSKRTHEI